MIGAHHSPIMGFFFGCGSAIDITLANRRVVRDHLLG
jgi:hypothetical protein